MADLKAWSHGVRKANSKELIANAIRIHPEIRTMMEVNKSEVY